MASENSELLGQLQELDNSASMLVKLKSSLASQLDEQKRIADDEARERVALLGKYRNMEHELDSMRAHLDEEVGSKVSACIQGGG